MAAPFLEIGNLHGWYGESHVLHGVDFEVREGEVVTLLGRNGAGRTSTLRAILGLIGSRKGSIKLRGQETIGMPTHRIARLGLGYCPEERGIFSSLSAEENLMLPPTLALGPTPLASEPGPLSTSTRSNISVGVFCSGARPYTPLMASDDDPTPKPRMMKFSTTWPSFVVVRTDGSVQTAAVMGCPDVSYQAMSVEPSSATVLAAVLAQPQRFAGLRVGLVLSGGNVDLPALRWGAP